MTQNIVIDNRRVRAGRAKRRLGQTGLGVRGERQILGCVRPRRIAIPLIVVGNAEVIGTTESRVIRFARVARRKVVGELIVGLQVGIDVGRVGRVDDRVRPLVFQHDDKDMIVPRNTLDVHRSLLGGRDLRHIVAIDHFGGERKSVGENHRFVQYRSLLYLIGYRIGIGQDVGRINAETLGECFFGVRICHAVIFDQTQQFCRQRRD